MEQLFITAHQWLGSGGAPALLGAFVWGLVSVAFSPCHLASIPLIVTYVAGQEHAVRPRSAARYALAFTLGLFITIALVGLACSLLGLMLGDLGPWWTVLVGLVLVWVALDMLGVKAVAMSSAMPSQLKVRGVGGALVLGLFYGLLSGSCTFGFIAPILAVITVRGDLAWGLALIVVFGLGHALPIAAAGSSTALVGGLLADARFQRGSLWFRRAAGVGIALLGLYFMASPLMGA